MNYDPWRPMKVGALCLFGFLVLGGGLLSGYAWYANARLHRGPQIGQAAPSFVATGQDGRTHRLSDYRKRAVALAFLTGDDRDSNAEMRAMNASIHDFDTIGMKVFGVAPMSVDEARALHDREKLEYPLLSDPNGALAARYGAMGDEGTPRRVSVVIGPGGKALLPVYEVHPAEHGKQLVELTECCLDTKAPPHSDLLGGPVADFRLPAVSDGRAVSLFGDGKQKATVLLFISARCPCSGHYDLRNRDFARDYGPQGVRFVAVNSSAGETRQEIADHARTAGFGFPVLRDEGNVIADRMAAQVTPEVYVMDSRRILRYHGRIDDSRELREVKSNDLRNALDFLLAGRNPARPEVASFGCAIARVEPRMAATRAAR